MGDDHRNAVISLLERRRHLGECQHARLMVDERHALVECLACGEKLNPISVLTRVAREESRLGALIDSYRTARADWEKRQRTKCQHCGRMTRISI